MSTSTIYIIGAVVLLAIFVLIGRLAVRWLVRLTMIGVILIALVAVPFSGGGLAASLTNPQLPSNAPLQVNARRIVNER